MVFVLGSSGVCRGKAAVKGEAASLNLRSREGGACGGPRCSLSALSLADSLN